VKFVFETSKKMLSTASIFTRAVVDRMPGSVTTSVPSFGVLAASTYGYVWPPSTESEIFTLAALVGGRSVFALSHVTVCWDPLGQFTGLFGEVTRNGPAFAASVSVTSPLVLPPAPGWRSRAVARKCSAVGV
jgi:hypothetical protein